MRHRPGAVAAALLLAVAAGVHAQGNYPDKPIKLVVGFPPGTAADLVARILAPKLAENLGQQVVVDNKPGAGSSVGTELVAHAPADGYTLLTVSIANAVIPSLYKNLNYDFLKDFAPVGQAAEVPGILVGHPALPARSVKELIALAKSKPGDILYGSSGIGTVTQLYAEQFGLSTGVRFTQIPFKGSSQAVIDLLAGRVMLMFTPASTVVPHVLTGRLRAYGVIGRERLAALPDLPTLSELGVAGLESGLWFGLAAPAATPRAIVERLNKDAVHALALPEVKTQFAAQSMTPASGTIEQFGSLIRGETEKWSRVAKAAGIKPE
ncbi:MAG TPA: tripartite tricarboxylate transporter substrate binding protein [Burkholderiales bacterium]|nr:tripartite tricarboxylate transporter substrate binding protein [Burkholderiales bacterium]